VECGTGITSSVPAFEGLALAHASTSLEYGGQDVSVNIRHSLEDVGIQVDAGYARMLKERLAYVNINGSNLGGPGPQLTHFSLPDGTDVSVDSNLFSDCTEKIFVNTMEPAGLFAQIHESIQLCDETLMKDLSHNIIISGGSSMMSGDETQFITRTPLSNTSDCSYCV
jgi:actin-related protein